MTATDQLTAAISKHNARMDAHAAHGDKVHAMFAARARGKKKQPTKAEYEAEWNAFNAENDSIKRTGIRPLLDLADEVGVKLQVAKGWKVAIADLVTA